MSAYFLKNEHREHLKMLRDKPPDVVVDFCKLALDNLTNGSSEKKYVSLAKKLNTSPEHVQPTVEALLFLLVDTTKSNVTEVEFEHLKSLGFSLDIIAILWQFVSSKRSFIENILKATSVKDYRFRDVEWRLEGKIASRCLLNQHSPIVTLKFFLDTEPVGENRDLTKPSMARLKSITQKEILAETDPHNLVHMIEVLDQALVESKTHRARNILHAFQ